MVLTLSEQDVQRAISMADGVRLIETAFRHHANGETTVLPRVSLAVPDAAGMFRIMAASVPSVGVFGLKTLTGYPGRRLAGQTYFAILLFDVTTGALCAVIAANFLTGIRTGAASGVAAKYLSRPDARRLGIIGAGVQAKFQVAALMEVRRLAQVKVFDLDRVRAATFARDIESEFGSRAVVVESARQAVEGSDLVVAVTTSRETVVRGEWFEPGMHVSGVGANAPAKRELDGMAFARSKVVVDFTEQALQEAGDLQEAVRTGAITVEHIHAELGDVLTGRKGGRANDEEITLFKSVGVAVEDIATASFVYERALAAGIGRSLEFDGATSVSAAPTGHSGTRS